MKSYDVTIQMKALCLYFHMLKSHDLFVKILEMKFGNLLEICLRPNLAVNGLKVKVIVFVIVVVIFFFFAFLLFLVSNNTLLLGQRRPQA